MSRAQRRVLRVLERGGCIDESNRRLALRLQAMGRVAPSTLAVLIQHGWVAPALPPPWSPARPWIISRAGRAALEGDGAYPAAPRGSAG